REAGRRPGRPVRPPGPAERRRVRLLDGHAHGDADGDRGPRADLQPDPGRHRRAAVPAPPPGRRVDEHGRGDAGRGSGDHHPALPAQLPPIRRRAGRGSARAGGLHRGQEPAAGPRSPRAPADARSGGGWSAGPGGRRSRGTGPRLPLRQGGDGARLRPLLCNPPRAHQGGGVRLPGRPAGRSLGALSFGTAAKIGHKARRQSGLAKTTDRVFSSPCREVSVSVVRKLSERDGERRRGDPSERYRTVCEPMSEGFVICEVIRDETGRLVDYWARDANPAFLRRAPRGAEMIGRRFSETRPNAHPRWFTACHVALTRGEPVRFEFWDDQALRWYDVHMTRLSDDEVGQFFVDISERKKAEGYQAELFDELNHRVKNNLTI